MKNVFACSILRIYFLVLLCSSASAAPDGLIHHWNLDEGPDWHDAAFQSVSSAVTAHDSVGSADAGLKNMENADWVSGRQYTCLDFDGVDDYLQAAADLAPTLRGSASLSFWIQTTQIGGSDAGNSPGVTGSDLAGDANDIHWGWIDSEGKIVLSALGADVVRSATAINDGLWHHVVLTRNAATGAGQVYLNGELSASATGPTGSATSAFHSLGRIENPAGAAGYLRGRLDQIHVYNKVIDPSAIEVLRDNHAPKVWTSETHGTNSAPFSTESVFFKAYDPEQDSLTVVSHAQGANGSVSDNGDGTFTYSPESGFTGADSFEVVIEDGQGGFASVLMRVQVLGASDPDASKRTTAFTDLETIMAGGSAVTLSGNRVPRAIDWEGDGDYDLLVGHGGAIWRFVNTGSVSAPAFAAGVKVQANSLNISLSGSVNITLADLTGDGVDDLVTVDSSRKIRIYKNTASVGQIPLYEAATFAPDSSGGDFTLPDQRFDVGDWDGDGLQDVIMGNRSGEVRVYSNVGTLSSPSYASDQYEVLHSGSYNLYPRLFDINRNGILDYIRGINWGSINYWFDPALHEGLGSGSGTLGISYSDGSNPNIKSLTDGAIVDFADFNGDGVLDLLMGGYANQNLFLAYGKVDTVADSIAEIEAIYDAHPSDLGAALEANDQALLEQIKGAERNIISKMFSATLTERQTMFNQMVAHVAKYSFLQMDSPLDTDLYNHVPGIAGQNLMTMHQMLPDTPAHRQNVANALALAGLHREIYLASSLHVGDNQNGSQGQLESVRDFMHYQPRPVFPDGMVTLNHYRGNGRGGHVDSFTGAKNTFDFWEGNDGDEWPSDIKTPIQDIFGTNAQRGDGFTFVLGHEATHSMPGYLNNRANKDLKRRHGQKLVLAGGPDIVGGSNGWIDWNATKELFKTKGYWDGVGGNWNDAWDAYWDSGPGSAWRNSSFMRGNIGWFFQNSQESLATQGNQHWPHSEGRFVGAIDRWRRGVESGISPMMANVTEVVTFLDFISAGLNKVVMYDTHGVKTPYPHATYAITHAWLERNDKGYITRMTIEDRVYQFTLDSDGIVTGVSTNILNIADDTYSFYNDRSATLPVVENDHWLEGGDVKSIDSFTSPSKGTLSDLGAGKLEYTPNTGYTGPDSFTYTVVAEGKSYVATVNLTVTGPATLWAHWKMDEGSATTASDATGNGYDAELKNGPQWIAGKMGTGALELDGGDDFLQIDKALNLNSNSLTISGWINRRGIQPVWAGLFFTRGGNSTVGFNFGSDHELRYHWANGQYGWNSGLKVPDGAWTFVALVIEPNQATIYMNDGNDMQSAEHSATHEVEEFDGVAYLGQDPNSASRRFLGSMDDFRIYKGALESQEINSLYNPKSFLASVSAKWSLYD